MSSNKVFNKAFGDVGEDIAAKYLQEKGFLILKRNYKNYIGEIDIVCMDQEYLVFVEVKSRFDTRFGMPNEAVDEIKRKKIFDTSSVYISERNCDGVDIRYDIIEVLKNNDEVSINHIENAFSIDEF